MKINNYSLIKQQKKSKKYKNYKKNLVKFNGNLINQHYNNN